MADTQIIGENDLLYVEVGESFRNSRTEEITRSKMHPDARAVMAIDLLRAWGMVQGQPGGEDASGRARMDLMPVAQVVDRAMQMTELAFAEMTARGWLIQLVRPATDDGAE